MISDLKPPIDAILESIKRHVEDLKRIEKDSPAGDAAARLPPGSFEMMRLQEIGGLCSQLRCLEASIVADDKLEEIIAALRGIDYRHAAIHGTMEALKARKAAAA